MAIFKRMLFREERREIVYGATDTGRQRDCNEDCYLIMPDLDIYAVADGMGGHNAGAMASQCAVKAMSEYFTDRLVTEIRQNPDEIESKLKDALMIAHQRIIEITASKSEYAGMGTTVALSFIHDNVLHTCHVGDSRVYIINPQSIRQVTEDHSTVAELVRMGKMTKSEARHSPLKNRITQAIGAAFAIEPAYNQIHSLRKGDVILLCSDGLWEMLSDKEILKIVLSRSNIKDACEHLIRRANAAGGDDNITVVIVKVGGENGNVATAVRYPR